jgi:hypothetical protein
MQKTAIPRPPAPCAVAAALALAALLALAGCAHDTTFGPHAQRGVLDLRAYDPAASGPAHLDGQWEFHWGRLLEPQDFAPGAGAPEPTGYFAMPGTWKGLVVYGEKLGGTGLATFRLRVRLWPDARRLTLRLYDIPVAYRLWADGAPVAHSGTLGTDAATERPGRSLVLAEVEPRGDEMELVLQVSNHYFRAGACPTASRSPRPAPWKPPATGNGPYPSSSPAASSSPQCTTWPCSDWPKRYPRPCISASTACSPSATA